MRLTFAIIALTTLSASHMSAQATEKDLARARKILASTPLIDGHNDLAWAIREDSTAPMDVGAYDLRKRTKGHTDLERLKKGMIAGQFWSIYVPGEVETKDAGYAKTQLEQFDIAHRFIAMYPDRLQLALSAQDVRDAFKRGKIASLLGMEGGHVIENSLGALRSYYDLGARYLTLTHNVTLDWADAALDSARHGGLTEFGKEVVREMNRLGMLVDLSHVSPGVMSDALDVSEAPVIFSHSDALALANVPRNVPDSILRRLEKNGGVVMVTFVPGFVSQQMADYEHEFSESQKAARQRLGSGDHEALHREGESWKAEHPQPQVTLSQVADHIEYMRKVAGVDHIGLGGDFDGISAVIKGLEDVSTYPALFAELVHRGWSDEDLRKLAGENILRALSKAEEVSARLRKTRAPSTKTIIQLDGKK
ncbi:MAG TPA: dipeptidase [Gemmatimonadaceae bacterium]|nr:dipeptidase [Gemmatimonadaceae bacterium]